MASSEQVASGILTPTFPQYFGAEEALSDLFESKLSAADFDGVAINAPKEIPIGAHSELPVVLGTKETLLRAWEVVRGQNCVLIATESNTGQVRMAQAFPDPPGKALFVAAPEATRGPKPEGATAEGTVATVRKIDAKKLLSLPWQPGTFSLAIVMYDWASNQVQVSLQGDGERAKAEPKEVSPRPKVPKAPEDATPADAKAPPEMPTYERNIKTPPLAGGRAALDIDTSPLSDAKLAVHGAFSTTIKSYHLPKSEETHRLRDGQQHPVRAVVPVTVAVLAVDWQVPMRFDWAVPVYGNQELQVGAKVEGQFSIDALEGSEIKLKVGKYVAYLVLDGSVLGPKSFEVKPAPRRKK